MIFSRLSHICGLLRETADEDMLVLGIESSCDETGLALIRVEASSAPILVGEVLSSQVALHEKYGGVVPELASREHLKNLPILFEQLLDRTNCCIEDIDAIGVTCGPGLKGCLLVGVTFAQGLSSSSGIPIVAVNHIEGHILSAQMHYPHLRPPYLALVVSGGHTEIILVEAIGQYRCICRTQDDAAGEAFDKSAYLMGLGYPGGVDLANLADAFSGKSRLTLPRVAREIESFSFSGLKTAIASLVKREATALRDDKERAEIAWTIQDSIVDALLYKTKKALDLYDVPLVVCGGVSANQELQRRLRQLCANVFVPPLKHCVDNGAMIAYAAACHILEGHSYGHLDIHSRWPVEMLKDFYGLS